MPILFRRLVFLVEGTSNDGMLPLEERDALGCESSVQRVQEESRHCAGVARVIHAFI